MNVFEKPVADGVVLTRSDLKRLFRRYARKLHPDATGEAGSNAAFVKLRADYEAALGMLAAPKGAPEPVEPPTRDELYSDFFALVNSGFPVALSVRASSKFHVDRVRDFAESFDAYGALPGTPFSEIERELYALRGDDIIDNPLFGKLRLIFYNMRTWHCRPMAFTKQALVKWFAEFDAGIAPRKLPAARAFIAWFATDLSNGPALAEPDHR